mgnify:FL=1|jgi:GTP-binding protein
MANNEPNEQAEIIETNYLKNLDFDFGVEVTEKGKKLFSQPVKFIAASNSMQSLPEESVPEVAFAGRSNVGKSSLINSITGRKFIARTSQNPGRTQQLNFFEIGNENFRLVDFPGFGYAKASKTSIQSWNRLIKSYIKYRSTLKRVLLLIDSRRGITAADKEAMDAFNKLAVSYQIILTKVDKIKAKELQFTIEKVKDECNVNSAAHPFVHLTSSVKGTGIDFLRADIARLI